MRVLIISLLAVPALALAACGPSVQEQCAGAKDVVTCETVARSGGDVQDYLVGGLAGAAIASAMTRPAAHPTVIHHAPAYGYRPSYRSIRQTAPTKTVTTTTRRGVFGSRSVTRTTTSYRPSYRSRR